MNERRLLDLLGSRALKCLNGFNYWKTVRWEKLVLPLRLIVNATNAEFVCIRLSKSTCCDANSFGTGGLTFG